MEITIKSDGRNMTVEVSVEVNEFLTEAKTSAASAARKERRHRDKREYDEYIVAAEGRLPYRESPEETVCRRETRDEILSVLALCTPTQRERFLLYALYDFSYAEIGRLCGCSKYAIRESVEAVRKIFKKSFANHPHD